MFFMAATASLNERGRFLGRGSRRNGLLNADRHFGHSRFSSQILALQLSALFKQVVGGEGSDRAVPTTEVRLVCASIARRVAMINGVLIVSVR
jgi:hypothetical protein